MQPSRALLPILLLAAGLAAGGQSLSLRLDWGGAALGRPFPVTGGVPFARGALADADAVRLTARGRPLPLQAEVLAWWPDGSVKWLLLDFQAAPGLERLTLDYGPGVERPPARGIVARAEADAVTVDTGPLKFRVREGGSGFIDDLWFRGTRVAAAGEGRRHFMDFVHTDSPADYRPMSRLVRGGRPDASTLVVDAVILEKRGPLHAVVRVDGRTTYRHVGSTIEGTEAKGACPFRLRLHAYAGQSFLRVEHFFVYEGDGDHDFVRALGLRLPLPPGASTIRFIGDAVVRPEQPVAGLCQQSADDFQVWASDGRAVQVVHLGGRFEGVLDVAGEGAGLAMGVKELWQNHAKGLRADLQARHATIYLWPPEAPPLDFRRHAREWSVGETGEPDDKRSDKPAPFRAQRRPNYRLASKGTGKTHYAFIHLHGPEEKPRDIRALHALVDHRPLLWASPAHYARSLALGRYRERVPGEHEALEEALDAPIRFWRFSQDHFRWYGIWLYGNLCQCINTYLPIGRWERSFGRWGWANGDSMGRLGYALVLQALRKCERADLEFAESYLYNVHDVCSVHSPAYPEHFGSHFAYFKGTSHRHGAWPWACPYTGIRGSHPAGAKIYYYLTGEGHVRDILDEVTQLALTRPSGGMGDGPLGPNAQAFLYKWETTGEARWREKLEEELTGSSLQDASGGWEVMLHAAFGIYNALEEYMELTGDRSLAPLAARFADQAMPEKMKRHWTRLGYYRVYAAAYNITGQRKYAEAIEQMLPLYIEEARKSIALKLPPEAWPGKAGGPRFFADGNSIRDIPFALYALHAARKEGQR